MELENPRRRWFRFRLRTLLIMVTLLSVPLGWVGWELDQRRREKATIAWVKEMGGTVNFNPFYSRTYEGSWWEKTKDKWFGERVRIVDLNARFWNENTKVNDLSPLAELKKLKRLWLDHNQVSEEQVVDLRLALPNCEIAFESFGSTD